MIFFAFISSFCRSIIIRFIYSSFQLHHSQLYHEPINYQLLVALKVNWLQHCTGTVEVRDRILASLNFLRLSFRNCISCIFNCDDLVCIYFFISQFQNIRFIYSSFHLHLSQMYHEPIKWPAASCLVAQFVRALHWYCRGQGLNPSKPGFLQAFFPQLHKLHY